MSDFDVFSNRWEITGKITLVTPLRIGGGQNAGAYSLSQSPVLLSYDAHTQTAQPYLPGSSLKGVLRSTMERIIRTLNEKKSCIAVGEIRAVNNVL
ncbi:MAG TPA: RAMP superfamily CRISPR-associated protein, partial [Anaerolineae bacterium]|nr:RAMP superfamily CRISPR-associated protein [Anaerolineae bacterium]